MLDSCPIRKGVAMAKITVKLSGFALIALIALFAASCSSSKKAETEKPETILAKQEARFLPEEFDSMVKNQIQASPSRAIWLEKYATDETRLEIEKMRKEKEALAAEVEKQKKEKEIFMTGVENLREEKAQLNHQVLQLTQEKEQLKKLSDSASADKQKISALEAKISALEKERENIPSIKEEAPKAPSVISRKIANEVPVCLAYRWNRNYVIHTAYFKITSKKTGKFFVYEVNDFSTPDRPAYKIVKLAPGEYTVQVTAPIVPTFPVPSASSTRGRGKANPHTPQTFTVSEEPIADFQRQKVHAVVSF